MTTIGFIGSGNIATAMARGWSQSELSFLFTDGGSGRAQAIADEVEGEALASNLELAKRSDLVVLAVKPSLLDTVGTEINDQAPVLLSVLGATTIEALESAFPETPIVRAMPNLGVEVGRGVVAYAAAPDADPAAVGRVTGLLDLLGLAVELEERLLDAATAVMGCSPAYLALVAGALIAAGEREGLAPGTARELVAETMAGTAELLRERAPDELIRAVASAGGSTEAGLGELEQRGVAAALAAAVEASLERMRGKL